MSTVNQLRSHQRLRGRAHQPGQPARHPQLVLRRGQEARDDQLPHLSPRKGRPVLRAHLRPGEGLGVRLRQVPRHEVQGHDLRPLRRQGHAQPRPPQAHGPHRAGRPRRPHLVLQGHAQPPRHAARHEDHQPGKDHLLPGLRRHRSGRDRRSRSASSSPRRSTARPARATATPSRPTWAPRPSRSSSSSSTSSSCRSELRDELRRREPEGQAVQAEAARPGQAAQGRRSRCATAAWAARRTSPSGWSWSASRSSRRTCGRWCCSTRQLRHQRPERSLSPHHQPQQPPQEAGRPQRPRGHHPQREADAAAVGRRPVRQQPLQAAGARLAATARSSR